MRKWRENEEMEREIHSQDFLILCLFPPSLSISYNKNCLILSQNVKSDTFVTKVKNCEKIILGRIRREKAPQVVLAWCRDKLEGIVKSVLPYL